MFPRREFLFGAAAASLLQAQGVASMDKYAFFGKFLAKPGQRDALLEYLKEAVQEVSKLPGCYLYIINTVPTEPDAICAYEIWRSEADHDASLQIESVKAIVAKARPLIAGGDPPIKMVPVVGKGL
jgi:quinol monooxygenase YgiN